MGIERSELSALTGLANDKIAAAPRGDLVQSPPATEARLPYTRVHRLLKILTLIQARSDCNAARLARECGVTERTIYRDIDNLLAAGVAIEFDHAAGGYRVSGEFFLPPVQLTPDEAMALSALCEHIAQREQIPFLKPAWKALSKIEAQLPAPIRDELSSLRESVTIQTAKSADADGHQDVYDRVSEAIRKRVALECEYESASGSTDGERFHFEPYALFFCVRAWYAVGRHNGRDDIRSLKLSRFCAMTLTDRAYSPPDDFSIETHLGNAWRMIRGETDHDVEIWFDAQFAPTVSDTRWRPDQRFEEHEDGSATFRCTVSGLDEVVWWVLSMGPHCVVKSPEELRQRVHELASQTAGLYG